MIFKGGALNFVVAEHNNGTAPYQDYEIDHLYVLKGGELRIDLDIYFEDDEEQVLTYNINKSRVKNLDITFQKSYMTIKLGKDFEDYEKFQVIVNDGTSDTGGHQIISDYVYVFEEKPKVEEPVDENTSKEKNDSGVNSSVIGGNVGNEEANSNLGDSLGGGGFNFKLLFSIMAILVVLGIIVFLVYFTIFKRAVKKAEEDGESSIIHEEDEGSVDVDEEGGEYDTKGLEENVDGKNNKGQEEEENKGSVSYDEL